MTTETRRRQVFALPAICGHTPARSARILASPCLGRPPFVLCVKNTYLLAFFAGWIAGLPRRQAASWTQCAVLLGRRINLRNRTVDSFSVGRRLSCCCERSGEVPAARRCCPPRGFPYLPLLVFHVDRTPPGVVRFAHQARERLVLLNELGRCGTTMR